MGNAEPCIFVIFGATGDLMRRKLLPALYRLAADGWMPNTCRILGVARAADMDDSRYRDWVRAALADDGFDDNEAIAKMRSSGHGNCPAIASTTSHCRRGRFPERSRRSARQACIAAAAGRALSSRSRSAATSRRRSS